MNIQNILIREKVNEKNKKESVFSFIVYRGVWNKTEIESIGIENFITFSIPFIVY
jgi:hypothetical protein